MSDEKKASEYNIEGGSVLHLVLALRLSLVRFAFVRFAAAVCLGGRSHYTCGRS